MIASHKGEIPFLLLLLPFLAGIGLGIYLPLPGSTLAFFIILIILTAVFIGLNIAYKSLNLYKFKWLGGILIHSILFLLGWLLTINYNELNDKDHFSGKKADYLVVKISNEPKLTGELVKFTIVAEHGIVKGNTITASGNLLITIKDKAARQLYYGDELLIPSTYNTIDPPFNPAEFNYKQYLANQNIHYQEYLTDGQYYILAKNKGNGLITYSLRLRQRLVEKLKLHLRSSEAIAVASTLILGYKADLSNDVLQAYSKTGTIHVLSVSGAHVAILFILLNFVFNFLNRFRFGKTIKPLLIILVIWYYSLLTGFSPAVCRAAVMISMVIIGKTYSRYINTLNILAVSAFFLLLYDPYFILDVGFQLSYLAVFGLIVLQPIVYQWIDIKNKWADKIWLLCSVSIAAQVITFPLSAYYFHQFPVYFLVSNLFIAIPSEIIMSVGIAYLILPDIPYVSASLGWVLEKSILLMNNVLTAVEHFPYSGINKIWITSLEYILLYMIIISLFYFLYDKKVWLLKLSLGCVFLLSCSISFKKWKHSKTDSISFLNLRKHTGILFKQGNQAVILTDLSDTDKAYRYSLQPYLDSCQVNKVYHVAPEANIRLPYLVKKSNLVQFEDKSVLLFDQQLQSAPLLQKIKSDYLYVMNNPDVRLNFINQYYSYNQLIIDNTNQNSLINNLKEQSVAQHVNYYILSRNKSVVVPFN